MRPPSGGFSAGAAALAGALAAALLGSALPSTLLAAPTLPDPALHEEGRAVYNFRCYFCHGYAGDARTLAASFLVPPPADFTAANPKSLPLARIEAALRNGRPGTAMKSFAEVIPETEIRAVSAFVFNEFVRRKAPNTRYHTPENGWPGHERYRPAFPFATGAISLEVPPETLSAAEQAGRRLYLGSCVSCHDRGKPSGSRLAWESRPLSYPRHNYDHRTPEVDAATSATPYHLHDRAPQLKAASPAARRGESIFQANCAFCHAADGTGKNWIGRFMEPPARNLTDTAVMARMTRKRLAATINDGLPGTSMPAWRNVLSEDQVNDLIAYIDAAFHPLAD